MISILMNWTILIFALILCSCATKPNLVFGKKIPSETLKMCFIGDTGTNNSVQKAVADMLAKEKCHSIHFLGDIIYSKGLKDHHDKQFYSKFWDYYKSITESDNRPDLYMELGNHDHKGSIDAWIQLSKKHPKIFYPYPWYLLHLNNVCVVHTDTDYYRFFSNYIMGTSQYRWVKNIDHDLKKCKVKIAVGHHPYNSSGKNHGNSAGVMRWILEKTILGKFNYYISGHEHILSDEGEIDGTRLLISGAGGRRDDQSGGFLVIEIKGDKSTYEFRSTK